MKRKQVSAGTLPGRADKSVAGRTVAVQNYAERTNARADLTADEKKRAIAKYSESMGVDLSTVE